MDFTKDLCNVMCDKTILVKIVWIFLLLLNSGFCFRYDRETENALCNTQCKALCKENKSACLTKCYSNVYRFWLVNCDEPFLHCIGACAVRERSPRNLISTVFTAPLYGDAVYDATIAASNFPSIPSLNIAGIKNNTILLSWDLPNSGDLVLHMIQMRDINRSTQWKTYQEGVEGNHLNISLPGICLYQFRIIAINKYGSNGFSAPISVKDVPLEPIHNITTAGNIFYNEPTGEILAVIQWDDISDLDDEVVANYDWNDVTMLHCPRISQNMQPIFEKFYGNRGRKFRVMRVSRDAYGCVFTTQIKAHSVCNDTGGWTNFTVDLRDCKAIQHFPCPPANISTPGNVGHIAMTANRSQSPVVIHLSWTPPLDLGTFGMIDHYEIRWGRVRAPDPRDFFQNYEFLTTPNTTNLKNEKTDNGENFIGKYVVINAMEVYRQAESAYPSRADSTSWSVNVSIDLLSTGSTSSLLYGFQIIPMGPRQRVANYDAFVINTIEISDNSQTSKGKVLMNRNGLQVVQLDKTLDLDIIWDFHAKSGHHADKYAAKVGRSVDDTAEKEPGAEQFYILEGSSN